MLKSAELVKSLTASAVDALRAVLRPVSALSVESVENKQGGAVDFVAVVRLGGRRHELACRVIDNGQPRFARVAIFELQRAVERDYRGAVGVLVAPYLSEAVRELCAAEGVGGVDLVGNVRLAFGSVYIERQVQERPVAEERELKSLFRRQAGRVLKVMLREPRRAWKVEELARESGVSLGHVSNVRGGLLEREWAETGAQGMWLKQPEAVLEEWREVYEGVGCKVERYYTVRHGKALEEAAREVLGQGRAVYGGYSAANWLAPYVRSGMHSFYANEAGMRGLEQALQLGPARHGENVVITVPRHEDVLEDVVEVEAGVWCTGLVQTYLDLWVAGERGKEAAEHLREVRLRWQ